MGSVDGKIWGMKANMRDSIDRAFGKPVSRGGGKYERFMGILAGVCVLTPAILSLCGIIYLVIIIAASLTR